MKIEKVKIKLDLLLRKVVEYKHSTFNNGINASISEVKILWSQYNELRLILISIEPEWFDDLLEVNLPVPEEALSFSPFEPRTPLYFDYHFDGLLDEVRKADEYMEHILTKHKQKPTSEITITAEKGAMVSIIHGDNNSVNQHKGDIVKLSKELQDLGMDKGDLQSFEEIVKKDSSNEKKNGMGKAMLKWAGNLVTKITEKGVTENLPTIFKKLEILTHEITQTIINSQQIP